MPDTNTIYNSLDYFFSSECFNYYCIIFAAFLVGRVHSRYRFIAWAVFIEFLLHQLIYNHFFLDLRATNNWAIYYMYAAIQIPIIFALVTMKCHFVIAGLMGVNFIYNLSVPLSFFSPEFISIYLFKNILIGTIMLLELLYLGWLCEYVNNRKRKSGYVDYDRVDRVFYVSGWLFNRGLA